MFRRFSFRQFESLKAWWNNETIVNTPRVCVPRRTLKRRGTSRCRSSCSSLPLFSRENRIEKTMPPNGIPRCKGRKEKIVSRKNHGHFFRGEDERDRKNGRIIIESIINLRGYTIIHKIGRRYYLFSITRTVINRYCPLLNLSIDRSIYSSLHSFRISLSSKDLQLSRRILLHFQMLFLGNGRT